MPARTTLRAVRWTWQRLFGPPRVERTPYGYLRVRHFGRVFEASNYDGLIDIVGRERERLMQSTLKLHEGAATKSVVAGSRFGAVDMYQREVRRVEARLTAYNDLLAHLVRCARQQS
jgi:hypothetical protein